MSILDAKNNVTMSHRDRMIGRSYDFYELPLNDHSIHNDEVIDEVVYRHCHEEEQRLFYSGTLDDDPEDERDMNRNGVSVIMSPATCTTTTTTHGGKRRRPRSLSNSDDSYSSMTSGCPITGSCSLPHLSSLSLSSMSSSISLSNDTTTADRQLYDDGYGDVDRHVLLNDNETNMDDDATAAASTTTMTHDNENDADHTFYRLTKRHRACMDLTTLAKQQLLSQSTSSSSLALLLHTSSSSPSASELLLVHNNDTTTTIATVSDNNPTSDDDDDDDDDVDDAGWGFYV